MFRVRATLIALGAASLALTGCTASAEPRPDLAEFYGQRIAFEPCAPYATTAVDGKLFADARFDCARVQVPLDYAEPDGPRSQVALLRLPARGEKIGSLLVNPGGPGGSGMSFVAQLAQLWAEGPVSERFDVIGFDPRGVGASTPQANCYTDAEKDRGEDFAGQLVPDVPDAQAAREVAQRCADGSGGPQALASFGTANVVRDMDVLRSVLGDEKLSYLGWSYGTQLGARYAETFPQHVRALALDGAIDPDLTTTEFHLAQMTSIQQAFDRFAANCATSADCPLGTDPGRATEAFQALVRPLQEKPAPTADGRGLNYSDALTAVTSALYSPRLWPKATEGLAELAAGRGDLLLAQRDIAAGRGPDGRYSNSGDAVYAIRCMDSPRRTPAEQAEFARQVSAAVPFADPGRPVPESHHECEAWPEPPTMPEPWITGPVDVPPTLTVSITGDPATPYRGGVNLARVLGGSLLSVNGSQHGIALLGQSECVDDIVADYLINLRTPPEGARCSA
ncbi:alpha/beta hydrolase fold [Saccharopolyspora kobensis]|uniref:Alpha/beta hydrolase fold n=1 Tax=Saccharopolyspora kobensis TaxID=146035 RepID=A0A1H6CUM9_9PSEU|nr:alpha/beta hydrolase [Saccharopolyspora kobensis]SEG76789.1 alpha/beta hydrolase fold [Saccharopolyspora kobensis]SFD00347.1 alpha/beta hydrolase fold [Saccharopolyspora kobensis]